MKILFFGKNSFSAKYLIKELNKNNKVISFSRKKINKNDNIFDLSKKIKISNKILNRRNFVFIFSSYVPIDEKKSNWERCKKINIYGICNLLKSIKKPYKIILASTCALYGYNKNKINENTLLRPNNNYSLSKFEQENLVRIFCMNNNIKFTSYRLGYVFGDGINKKRLIYKILKKHKKGTKIKIYNKNLNLNLIHTKEISSFISKTFKTSEGIYNLTNSNLITLDLFNESLKKNIIPNKKNLFTSRIYKEYPKIKKTSFQALIDLFKNGN